MNDKIAVLRLKIKQRCMDLIQNRLLEIQSEMSKVQDSANNETKSSMGDKYETGRAMAQNELEKLSIFLAETQKQLRILTQIQDLNEKVARVGSLVQLDGQWYFIASGLGAIKVEEIQVFVVSNQAPIAKLLIGKRVGESLIFNEKVLTIAQICNVS